MRLLGYLGAACIGLALLQAAAQVIALLLLAGALVTFVTKPKETIALVTTLGVLNLVAMYPLAAIGVAGGLAVGKVLAHRLKAAERSRNRGQAVPRIANQPESKAD